MGLGRTKLAGEIHQGQEMNQDGQSRGAWVAQTIKGGLTGDEVERTGARSVGTRIKTLIKFNREPEDFK